MTFDYGTTEFDAPALARVLGGEWTENRLYGMYGPGTIFTLNVEQDDDPGIKPWESELEDAAVYFLRKREYDIPDCIGKDVPDVLQDAVSELNYKHGEFDYDRYGDNYPLRVLKRLAGLHGYIVQFVQLTGSVQSDWANILILGTSQAMVDSIRDEWSMYFGGEVYGYTLDGNGADESCWGYYGLDELTSEVTDAMRYEVAKHSHEVSRAKAV